MDHARTITSMMWEHLKSGWMGAPEELIRKVKMNCDRQVVLESGGYRSATWHTLRVLQQVHGAEEIWDCTCVTAPSFFRQIDSPSGRSYETATDKTVLIMWDGLNMEERENGMRWMTRSKSWLLWRQHDSSSSTTTVENATEEKLQSLLGECGWSLTGKEGKANEDWTRGSVRYKNWWCSGQVKLAQSRVTMECWVSGWTAPKQEMTEAVREEWMWELGKDECVRTDAGPEAAYWRGTEFSRMSGYNFPGQIAASDGSESNGVMGTGFIVLGNSAATGSIRVDRTEEDTDSTRTEMADLLEVLIGAKVTENLVVMVDNQSILWEISRWVDEGGRTFLTLSANPDILRMVIGRLCMRIEQGTATILCKIEIHRSEPLNETADDLADLGRTTDQEHAVWTTRSNRMVFSWMDGQKRARTSTWNQGVKNGVRLGAGRYRFEARLYKECATGCKGWRALPSGVDRVTSRAEIRLHTRIH
jgi:ribonuclease HI